MTFEFCAFPSARRFSIVGLFYVRQSTSPAIAARISIWCDEFIMQTMVQWCSLQQMRAEVCQEI